MSIEIHLCERGDLFVSEDGAPVSSPYDCGADFWTKLRRQKYVTLRFDTMEHAERLIAQYMGIWLRQMPKAVQAYRAVEQRRASH